jgi:surface-anchored protein
VVWFGGIALPLRLRLVWLVWMALGATASAQHLHLQAQFQTGSGWSLFWHDFDAGAFPADAFTQPLGADSRQRMVAVPALNDALVPPDHAVWTLPQFATGDLPSLGLGTQGTAGTLAGGTLRMRLATFAGPGAFALHTSGTFGETTVLIATRDGLDATDAVTLGFPGGHEHANWSFTRPGLYELGFVAEGTLASTGQPTNSAVTVFRFRVVEPVPPRLTILRSAGQVVLSAESEPNLPLRLDSAVEPGAWSLGSVHWSVNGLLSWTNSASDPVRFFRLSVPLP